MILCSGCFDGLHAGHVGYLEAVARITQQHVYVAVAPDTYIRELKGVNPRWLEGQRLAALRGLRCVQEVFLHGPEGVASVIRNGRALSRHWDAFAKGKDWRNSLQPDVLAACAETGTALLFVDSGYDLHTHET